MRFREVDGDLIKLAQQGEFDVIAHGCNCFCTMGAGIAPQMVKTFGADTFELEKVGFRGSINKLGNIDFKAVRLVYEKDHPSFYGRTGQIYIPEFEKLEKVLYAVNAYTQYNYGRNHVDGDNKPINYAALELCFIKMNSVFKGKHIGLPWIGCGLAGGDKHVVRILMTKFLKDCDVTVVNYKP